MAQKRPKSRRSARSRAMIADYWRREWRGERDPVYGVMRKFKLSPKAATLFFITHGIYEMSSTIH